MKKMFSGFTLPVAAFLFVFASLVLVACGSSETKEADSTPKAEPETSISVTDTTNTPVDSLKKDTTGQGQGGVNKH